MADAWKKLNQKIKEKRVTKGGQLSKKFQGDQLTIQRLSSEVSGKAQKYARVGPREFVQFDTNEELTINTIKRACEVHFAARIGSNMECDILAGEQGPSCKTINQIPNLKLIHVRFVGKINSSPTSSGLSPHAFDSQYHCIDSSKSASRVSRARSVCLPRKRKLEQHEASTSSSPTKYPMSMSLSKMIKLGKLNVDKPTTVVSIYKFDVVSVVWSKVPTVVEFLEETTPVGTGAYRNAFKASSKHSEFAGCDWVIKRYTSSGKDNIEELGLTLEDHTRKTVQMHLLAKNIASQLEQKIAKENTGRFGEVLKYKHIYYGVTEKDEHVTVEEYIPGNFIKYINNTGLACVEASNEFGLKAQCLTHFSYEKSNKMLMLLDVQGSGTSLYDPEIASSELVDSENRLLYCAGNLSTEAIECFKVNHTCNIYCELSGLSPLS